MARTVIDLTGNVIVADGFEGSSGNPSTEAEDVSVAAGDDGLTAENLQEALQTLATRVQALEDAG